MHLKSKGAPRDLPMGREHQTFGTWVVAVLNRAFPANFRWGLASTSKSVSAQCSRSRVAVAMDSLTYSDRKKLSDFELSNLRLRGGGRSNQIKEGRGGGGCRGRRLWGGGGRARSRGWRLHGI